MNKIMNDTGCSCPAKVGPVIEHYLTHVDAQ